MSLELLAEGLISSGLIQEDFAALVLMRRKANPLEERIAASLALADWYEERGRLVEAEAERKNAQTMTK